MWTHPGNLSIADSHMKVEIGTEAAQFPKKEYINSFFGSVFPQTLIFLLLNSIQCPPHLGNLSPSHG
jgi:hypothetical protein